MQSSLERSRWHGLGRLFRRAPALPPKPDAVAGQPTTEWSGALGAPEEEAIQGKASYLEVLERLHRELSPVSYLEIGVRRGGSLALARCPAVGIDPAPAIDRELPPTTKVHPLTSDDFFAKGAHGVTPDFSFVDGMHLFEFALRDFMNIERRAAPGAVIVLDDVLPNHPVQARRVRQTRAWTGDVWRVAEVLQRYRTDLFVLPIDAAPAGLLLVAGLDPANRVLWEGYSPIVREAADFDGPPPGALERRYAVDPGGPEFQRVIQALAALRRNRSPPNEIVAGLRRAFGKGEGRAPSAGRRPKLSVVVIGYNMARELPRTIRSLSPSVQRGIDPKDYEVILVDNGSTAAFDEAGLRRMLPGLVVHRMPDATVSPVPAINFGLAVARGDLIGVCIDGARMSSPGLLAKALAASRLHERPVIGTIAFHLGPEAQQESLKGGYNQAVEDELLERSRWEIDGYRLFGISSLALSSAGGWFELPAESNAFFVRSEHWRRLGGWDERFRAPGGGLANLDTWLRACSDPEAEVIMLLGEATFHQFHGGVSTNNSDAPQEIFHEEYVQIRGRAYERPTKRSLYFGELPDSIRSSLKHSLDRF
jgi:glycosyltransferase involved in cell wall biosynthesis